MRVGKAERVLLRQKGDSPKEDKPRRASASIEFNILHGSTNSSVAKSLEDSHFLSFQALQRQEGSYSGVTSDKGIFVFGSLGVRVSG